MSYEAEKHDMLIRNPYEHDALSGIADYRIEELTRRFLFGISLVIEGTFLAVR